MSVTLEPAELGFKRPFTQEVSQVLTLHNQNHEAVAFKVKTTAPKQYCVRPNSGRIDAGGSVQVQVLLQAMKEDPPVDARCRDKFLVQSVAIPSSQDVGTVTQIWTNIEQTAKSSIQEKKIRVSWLPADGSTVPVTNGASHLDDDVPPAYSSPASAAATPQRNTLAAARLAPDEKNIHQDTSPSTHYTTQPPSAPRQQTAVQSATAAVASATGISQAELQRKLDSANATIADLRQQAAEGLRQRKIIGDGSASEKSTTSTSLQSAPPAGGVPVHIVAGLCLLVFLIAYLFF